MISIGGPLGAAGPGGAAFVRLGGDPGLTGAGPCPGPALPGEKGAFAPAKPPPLGPFGACNPDPPALALPPAAAAPAGGK